MRYISMISAAVIAIALSGCDASYDKITAFGDAARVTCYSGDRLIFDDFSTGKINNSEQYYFRSASTGTLVEVSGNCVVNYNSAKPNGFKPVVP